MRENGKEKRTPSVKLLMIQVILEFEERKQVCSIGDITQSPDGEVGAPQLLFCFILKQQVARLISK